MNRLLLVLFGLMLLHSSVQAQDLLVTHAGDSISVAPIKELPRWSIGASMGYAHRTRARYNAGGYIDADVTLFCGEKRRHGVGLKYCYCVSGGGQSYYMPSYNPRSPAGYSWVYSEDVGISLIGVFGSYRLKGNRHCFLFRYGIGPMFYRNEKRGEIDKGTAFAIFGDIGYSFRITKHLSLGIKGGYAGGMVTSLWIENTQNTFRQRYSYEKLSKDNRVILDHLKVGVDLRFDI